MNTSILPTLATACRNAPREVSLEALQIWSATLPAGTRVRCRRGVIWLTISGERGDWVLRAGESFTAPQCGLVVVQSLENSGASFDVEANST